MDSNFKNDLPLRNNHGVDIQKRLGSSNGAYIHSVSRVHTKKMGTALKLVNVFGFSGMIFAFITNLGIAPYLSLFIGIVSGLWGLFRMLKMAEDWLYRRAERKAIEEDTRKKLERGHHKNQHHE